MAQTIAARLSQYLATCPPFHWRNHNCLQYTAAWVQLVEGTAPQAPGVQNYRAAHRALKNLHVSLASAVSLALQRRPQPPAQARVGDLVLVPQAKSSGSNHASLCMGICAGRTVALLSTAGVVHAPMLAAQHAWHLTEARPCAER